MICPKCGRQIPDGTVCPCSMGTPALSDNPALNVLKTVGSSSQFLVAAVLYSLGVLLTLIGNLSASSGIMGWILDYAYQFDVDMSYLYPYLQNMGGTSAFSAILSSIPTILMAVAFWLHYSTCRGVKSGGISTAGLTIWKVMTYIVLVCLIVLAAIFAISMVIILIGGTAVAGDEGAMVVGVVVFCVILLGAMLALILPYLVAKIRIINRAKNVAATGIPDNRVSQYYIVINWIMAIFNIISGVSMLFLTPLSGIAGLCSAVAVILYTLCLTRYRSEMSAVMYPPVQPVYAQPVEPAAPSQPAAPVEPAEPEASQDKPNE